MTAALEICAAKISIVTTYLAVIKTQTGKVK